MSQKNKDLIYAAAMRYGRGLASYALGAGVAVALGLIPQLDLGQRTELLAPIIGAAILAFDKFARGKGWY